MSATPFEIRTVIESSAGLDRYRVVWVDERGTWIMPMNKEFSAWPRRLDPEDADSYQVVPDEPPPPMTDAALKHAQCTFERYGGILNHIPGLLTESGRSKAFHALKKVEPTLSTSTFYKVVRRWLKGGAILSALSPTWCGKRKALEGADVKEIGLAEAEKACKAQAERLMRQTFASPAEPDHTKSGRPRKRFQINQPTRYRVDRQTLRVFQEHFRIKLKTPGLSLKKAHEQMLTAVFSSPMPSGPAKLWPSWCVPSWAQFEDWFFRTTGHNQRRIAARGQHHFDLNERSLLSQALSKAFTAGTVGELDATVWNVELVSEFDGAALIGPPIVFRIRCKDTAQLLGLSVGLESACWMGAASAIANCLKDKVAFCKEYDIDIGPDVWKVRGLPATIEADCGETHNHKPNRFITQTNTSIKNLQRARGDIKPGVESDWNTLQVSLNGMTPGAVVKAYEDKTDRQWRMAASMTLRQFTRVLLLEELKKMSTPREGLQLPHEMINADVDTSAASVWKWCLQNAPTALRVFDETAVRLSLLDTRKGSVTERGLQFRGILYDCTALSESEAAEKARRRGNLAVTVAFDPRLADVVYILEGDPVRPSRYLQCTLNTRRVDQRDYLGKTFQEVEQLARRGKQQNATAASDARQPISEWSAMQTQTIEAAKTRTAAERKARPTNPHALHANRASSREAERNALSPAQAIVPKPAPAPSSLPPGSVQSESSVPSSTHGSGNVVPISTSYSKKLTAFADRAAALKSSLNKPTQEV